MICNLDTINCFAENAQLRTQCIMIKLKKINIFCKYDLEILKNVILNGDQCHISQYTENFAAYSKILSIETEISNILNMVLIVENSQFKNKFLRICGEEIESMTIILIAKQSDISSSISNDTIQQQSTSKTNKYITRN